MEQLTAALAEGEREHAQELQLINDLERDKVYCCLKYLFYVIIILFESKATAIAERDHYKAQRDRVAAQLLVFFCFLKKKNRKFHFIFLIG